MLKSIQSYCSRRCCDYLAGCRVLSCQKRCHAGKATERDLRCRRRRESVESGQVLRNHTVELRVSKPQLTTVHHLLLLLYLPFFPRYHPKLRERWKFRLAVTNEALRIHPSTGLILERRCPKGGVVLHGKHIPENAIIGVNCWVVNRDKSIFGEDAHEFRPERWIDSDPKDVARMRMNMFTVRLLSMGIVVVCLI